MRRIPARLPIAFALLPLLLPPSPVRAGEGGGQRWHLDLRAGVASSGLGNSHESRYEPTLPSEPAATGEARQAIALAGGSGAAFGAALGYALTPGIGLQLLAGGHRVPLAVSSGPLEVRLQYESRQPPDYRPRPMESVSSAEMPGCEGELFQRHLAFNLAGRLRAGSAVSFGLSGGPVLHRLDGAVDGLGYRAFWMGGHGTLFSEVHRVRARIEPTWAVGANAGADVALRLGRRWSLLLDARWFWLPETDAGLSVDRVLNAGEILRPLDAGEIESGLALQPIGFGASFLAVTAGVRLHF